MAHYVKQQNKKIYYICQHCNKIVAGVVVFYDCMGIKPVCAMCRSQELLFLREIFGETF